MPESISTSLVRIHSKAGGVAGAGFLVSERHILTCVHVIAQALGLADDALNPPSSPVSLDFPRMASHTLLTARVVFWCPVQDDGRGDIAGLELLDKPPAGAEAIHFASSEQVWGHPCCAFGFPAGQDDGVWSDGRLLGRQGTNWIQLEDDKIPGFAVIAGFSGTPVWDEQLQGVVGMIVASSQPITTKTAFAIPSDALIASWPDLASLMRPLVPRNPYKGLHAFTEHDGRDFFGRDTLIDELATAVETALTHQQKEGRYARLLTVLGPSGSGKSSVVMAGLLPCLRADGVFDGKEWVYLDPVSPGEHPLEALAVSLAKQLPARGAVSLHDDLAPTSSTRSLHLLVCQLMASSQQRVVLIVDQFEEVFTLTTDETERQHFFELLVTAVTEPRGPLFVTLTLRADFYDRPMRYPELYRLIDDHHVSVLPMEREDLRRVIEEPANLPDVQLTFESGLVDELLFDMQGQSGALPLLEFTLDQLFRRRNGRQLTLQAYREMGGVKGALSQHAEETYQALPSDEHRQMAREVFVRLVSPGTTEQDTTRRRAARSEFERVDPVQTQRMQETLERFISARLLTTNQVGGTTTIEVSHEALIREWKRLAEWLREARNDILFQESLSEDVTEWEQRKRPRDRLYRGAQLKEARAWARRNWPSEQEVAFLRASAAQRTLGLMGVIVGILLLLTSTGVAGLLYLTRLPDPTLVTTLQDNVNGSLRYCIANANSGSTIRFAQGLRGTIELTGGNLVFVGGRQLTIRGPGADRITISGSDTNANMLVSKGAMLNISDLSFKNSKTTIFGFLYNEGTLTVANSIISNNEEDAHNSGYGGGIFNYTTGTLTIINSVISSNRVIHNNVGEGGGIDNQGKLTVTNSVISNNSVSSSSSNSSSSNGGGIYNTPTGILWLTNSTISNNSVSSFSSSGGGIANQGVITVTNSTISNNSVSNNSVSSFSSSGGGIANQGVITVTNSTISNNLASGGSSFGGGIYNTQGTTTVTNSTISNNSVSGSDNIGGNGGGIDNEGKLIVTNSTISNNKAVGNAGYGGGIYNYTEGITWLDSSTISNNLASGSKGDSAGGGINNGGTLTVANSTISNNKAVSNTISRGGGIWSFTFKKGTFAVIRFSTIYGNTSKAGGGIWVDPTGSSYMTISSSIVAVNSAYDGPDISGALISGGYNLLENVAGATGLNARTDRQVTLADLKIDSTLRDNGGPTQTLALLQGSKAIDAAPGKACSITITDVSGHTVTITTDQRGDPRPDGSENACDIGAYESSYQG